MKVRSTGIVECHKRWAPRTPMHTGDVLGEIVFRVTVAVEAASPSHLANPSNKELDKIQRMWYSRNTIDNCSIGSEDNTMTLTVQSDNHCPPNWVYLAIT